MWVAKSCCFASFRAWCPALFRILCPDSACVLQGTVGTVRLLIYINKGIVAPGCPDLFEMPGTVELFVKTLLLSPALPRTASGSGTGQGTSTGSTA